MRHRDLHLRRVHLGRHPVSRAPIVSSFRSTTLLQGYDYPAEVRFEIEEQELDSYLRAADFLNFANTDIVCLQHEFGIFGGPAGSHVLRLLRDLRMPIVTTLHTVLKRAQRPTSTGCFDQVAELSARVVVMSERARSFLGEIYGVPDAKIDLIAHGIPDMPFVDPNFYKDQFGVEGKFVALTFGLLSPNKGIEQCSGRCPRSSRSSPTSSTSFWGDPPELDPRAGRTLPDQPGAAGQGPGHQAERDLLQPVRRDRRADRIHRHGRHLHHALSEPGADHLGHAWPMRSAAARPSSRRPTGTPRSCWPMAAACWFPSATRQRWPAEICELLRDEPRRHVDAQEGLHAGPGDDLEPHRPSVHGIVPARAAEPARHAVQAAGGSHPGRAADGLAELAARPPGPDDRLDRHASARHLDDPQFRGGLLHRRQRPGPPPDRAAGATRPGSAQVHRLATTYAAFLNFAFDREPSRFRNFLSFDRRWLEDVGSDDCHGRALWALGACVGRSKRRDLQFWASQLFDLALPAIPETTSPRAWAFGLIWGLPLSPAVQRGRPASQMRDTLTDRLIELLRQDRDRRVAAGSRKSSATTTPSCPTP